jgi:hypothetical protein
MNICLGTSGAKPMYIAEWLSKLSSFTGLTPSWVHIDKDAAIQATWHNADIQLCLWHLDRAIAKRFSEQATLPNWGQYKPDCTIQGLEAYTEVFPCRQDSGETFGSREDHLSNIRSMMKRHFKWHPYTWPHVRSPCTIVSIRNTDTVCMILNE